MKVRHKTTAGEAVAIEFNTHGIGEMIVGFDDGGMSSVFIRDYEVFIETGPNAGKWRDMGDAFRDHDLITDNLNRRFFEPESNEDRERGWCK